MITRAESGPLRCTRTGEHVPTRPRRSRGAGGSSDGIHVHRKGLCFPRHALLGRCLVCQEAKHTKHRQARRKEGQRLSLRVLIKGRLGGMGRWEGSAVHVLAPLPCCPRPARYPQQTCCGAVPMQSCRRGQLCCEPLHPLSQAVLAHTREKAAHAGPGSATHRCHQVKGVERCLGVGRAVVPGPLVLLGQLGGSVGGSERACEFGELCWDR